MISELFNRVLTELSKAVVGQDDAATLVLIALVARGHALVEGVPGIAKTLLVKALAAITDADFKRIQCTPDLMPSDVTGTNVFSPATGEFRFVAGPVFTDFLLADEINRAVPKTQSALLESMEERQVTVDGVRRPVSERFVVVATENPVEFEGTYPLPEAQLDRFMLKISMSYPSPEDEVEVLRRHGSGFDPQDIESLGLRKIVTSRDVEEMRSEALSVRVTDEILKYVTDLAIASRDLEGVSLGISTRAAANLLVVSKIAAAAAERDFVVPDDVKNMAPHVWSHRILLQPEAEVEGMTAGAALERTFAMVEVPR